MANHPSAVLVICDGHRDDLVQAELCPTIAALAERGTRFRRHRAVFPSVTRASSASIATGQPPGVHGLHGNRMALPNGAGFDVHDVGEPGFVETLRRVRGRTLAVPTLAERLADGPGAVLFSNVSPGAAYFHDPDGHGAVYHRAGSYEARRRPADAPLRVQGDLDGDRQMTERFCEEVLLRRRPRLATLWLANPDKTMHGHPLGSEAHRRAIKGADACVSRVVETVARRRADGEDVLLLVGSDHGQETVRTVVPVERHLADAGFKTEAEDLVVAPQGSAALIYATDAVAETRLPAIAAWLTDQPWCASVHAGDALTDVGLAPSGGLRLAISMARDDDANAFGVRGRTDIATRFADDADAVGCGQHGGLGTFETHPFLVAVGRGFKAGAQSHGPSSVLDLAPTILTHLRLPITGLSGRALQVSTNDSTGS